MSDQLIIINNEKITFDNNKFYCDNIDVKSIPEGLENFFELEMISRNSSVKKSHHVNIKEINLGSNLIFFLYKVFKTLTKRNKK